MLLTPGSISDLAMRRCFLGKDTLCLFSIWKSTRLCAIEQMVGNRVVNGPTSSGPNPARTRKYKPEPRPNPKLIWSPNHTLKNLKVKLGLKNLTMLLSYFDYIFVHLNLKVRLKPKSSPNFLSTLGPNPNPIRKARPDLQLRLERSAVKADWKKSNKNFH